MSFEYGTDDPSSPTLEPRSAAFRARLPELPTREEKGVRMLAPAGKFDYDSTNGTKSIGLIARTNKGIYTGQ